MKAEERVVLVKIIRDFRDDRFEQTVRVRTGHHQARDVFRHRCFHAVQTHRAVFVRWHFNDFESRNRGAGRVGAVRGIGDEDRVFM